MRVCERERVFVRGYKNLCMSACMSVCLCVSVYVCVRERVCVWYNNVRAGE